MGHQRWTRSEYLFYKPRQITATERFRRDRNITRDVQRYHHPMFVTIKEYLCLFLSPWSTADAKIRTAVIYAHASHYAAKVACVRGVVAGVRCRDCKARRGPTTPVLRSGWQNVPSPDATPGLGPSKIRIQVQYRSPIRTVAIGLGNCAVGQVHILAYLTLPSAH